MVLALTLSLLVFQTEQVSSTGNDLLARCEKYQASEAGRAGIARVRAGQAKGQEAADALDLLSCRWYIQGFVDASVIHRAPEPGMSTTICLPDAPNYDQIIRVVVKYLRDHPEDLHHPRSALMYFALKTAFPCPKQ